VIHRRTISKGTLNGKRAPWALIPDPAMVQDLRTDAERAEVSVDSLCCALDALKQVGATLPAAWIGLPSDLASSDRGIPSRFGALTFRL
jgi:hypothetical protein